MRNYLLKQLNKVEITLYTQHEMWYDADEWQRIVDETVSHAARLGRPDIVDLSCRAGNYVETRLFLTKCLALCKNDNFMTPPVVAKKLGVGVAKVHRWIQSGMLPATNVTLSGRPKWRIDSNDLTQFIQTRQPVPRPVARRRKHKLQGGGKTFF
jgi:excisionase family DNA binding protein